MFLACSTEEAPNTVTKVIGRAGGQVSSHDGVLTLTFQSQALSSDTEFKISPSDTPPPIFGPAYRVQPDLDLEVAVEVSYRRVLPSDPSRTAVAAMHRESYELDNGRWAALPVTERDVKSQLVAGTDTEVSLFYALIEDASSLNPITTNGTNASSDSMGSATEGDTASETGGDTEFADISYAVDIQPIWDANCISSDCHAAGVNVPALDGDSYANIVGKGALSASFPLIEAGDSDLSYLMHKLDNTHALDANLGGCGCNGAGGVMPAGELGQLDEATRDLVRGWIDAGAPQ